MLWHLRYFWSTFFFFYGLQALCQELEAKFYEGTFNWDTVKQHDAASLLKFFIRELPLPLLTVEYMKAFHSVQCEMMFNLIFCFNMRYDSPTAEDFIVP